MHCIFSQLSWFVCFRLNIKTVFYEIYISDLFLYVITIYLKFSKFTCVTPSNSSLDKWKLTVAKTYLNCLGETF